MTDGIGIINGFDVSNKSPIDKRWGPYSGTTISECITTVIDSGSTTYIPEAYRYEGLTVLFKVNEEPIVEYWFIGGVDDLSLQEKIVDLESTYVNVSGDIMNGNLSITSGGLNVSGNTIIVGTLTATSFIKSGGTNLEFLMADGSVNTLSSLSILYDARYVNTSGDTMSGQLTVQSGVLADYYDISTTATPAYQMGRLSWNTEKFTLNMDTGLDSVSGQLMQELWYPPVTNKSGYDMINGTIAMVDPSQLIQGERFRIVKADSTYPAKMVLGMLTMDINNNQNGVVTKFGEVHDISYSSLVTAGLIDDTETWVAGNILYLSQTRPGGLTNIAPEAPYNKIACAVIQKFVGDDLDLFVRFEPTFSLNDINDLQIIGTPANGDFLQYNLANGRWENASYSTLEGNFDDRYVNLSGDTISGGLAVTSGITTPLLTFGTGTTISRQTITISNGTTAIVNGSTTNTDAVFFDYVMKNGTNSRAGTVTCVIDSNGNAEYNDISTLSIGDTSVFSFSVTSVAGVWTLIATVSSGEWNIKTLIRTL